MPIEIRCGTFSVYENRARASGRRLELAVRVVPSAARSPAPDPLVVVSTGGPGQTNSEVVPLGFFRAWRQDRDVVLVDLRGTSLGNRLDCPSSGSDAHPAGYLDPLFDPVRVAACRRLLEARADLTQYTTANVVDDLYDALRALGYSRVNLWGASGGTREVLEFLRRHPAIVRSAIVEGVAPVSFKNPLPHARAAQVALDSLFAQCARDPACASSFPNLRGEFLAVLDRLGKRPVRAPMPRELGGLDSTAQVTRDAFAEVVRTMSYAARNERTIPYMVHRAAAGDFTPFLMAGVAANQRIRESIRLGFLLSQTCTEDVPRITDAEIASQTAHTYIGDRRVLAQRAACAAWPRGLVRPADFTPVQSDVPVFLLSGSIDPVAPWSFAAEAAKHLSRSIHIIAPGGHVPGGPCVEAMERQFLRRAMPADVDTTCVATMTLPPFETSAAASPRGR